MELLVAILLALGSLTSPDTYTSDWEADNQDAVNQAQQIIDTDSYYYDERTGGVIVDGVNV